MLQKTLGLLRRSAGWLAFSGALLIAAPAFCQNAAADQSAQGAAADQTDQAATATAQNAAAPTNAGSLQEVVVTAERRAQDVQSLPIVVTAISGAQMLENHITQTQDIQLVAPGFSDVSLAGGLLQNANIRGIGETTTGDPGIPPGVATYRDGQYQAEVAGLDVPFFDIADIEVLDGPQGVLGGGSSVGGAVQINSADPNFRGLNGFVDSELGNYSEKKIDGAVNLQVNDVLALRLAFNEENRGSFYNDESAVVDVPSQQAGTSPDAIADPGQIDNSDLRLGILWKPTDNFQALAKWEYNSLNYGGEAAEPITAPYTSLFNGATCSETGPNGSIVCPGAGVTEHSTFYYPTEQPLVLDYGSQGQGTQQQYFTHESKYLLDLRDTLPGQIVLRSLSSLQTLYTSLEYWQSYSPLDNGTQLHELGPGDNYWEQELDLISPTTGKINWIAGAFFFYRQTPVGVDSPVFISPYSATPTNANGIPTDEVAEAYIHIGTLSRTAALFGNVNWQFTNTLQLQLGVRENWDNNGAQSEPDAGIYLPDEGPPNTLPGTPETLPCTTGGSKVGCAPNFGYFKDSVPTGKVDLNWTPAPGQNFYAFFARGYKAGVPNGNGTSAQPEHVNDWELGWKGTLLENHIVTQVGGYWMRYQDMDYAIYNFDDPAIGDSDTANLPPSTIEGISAAMQSRFGQLDFDFSADYNHSALGALTALNNNALPTNTPYGFNGTTGPPQCPASGPVPGCFNYLPYVQTLSGEANALSPLWTGNAVLDYRIPVGESTLQPRVKVSYVGSQYSNIFQTPYYFIPSHTLWDADLDFESGPWFASLYGTNVFNKIYIASNDGTDQYYGAPRQWGVRFQYTFGGAGGG